MTKTFHPETILADTVFESGAPRSETIMRRRLARTLSGAVGICGAMTMFLVCIIEVRLSVTALMATWPAMAAAYAVGWLASPLLARLWDARGTRELRSYRAVCADADPRTFEAISFIAPLSAAALLMPLSLHALLPLGGWLADCLSGSAELGTVDFKSYGDYIAMSGAIVGHAHLVLVGCCVYFVRRLGRSPQSTPAALQGCTAVAATTVASCIPGFILFFIPPVLTLVTGAVFVPALFALTRRLLLSERAAMLTASIHQPRLTFTPTGVEQQCHSGIGGQISWDRPFSVVLHRAPQPAEASICQVHARLVQSSSGRRQSVAMTLLLPSAPALLGLPVKEEVLATVARAGSARVWATIADLAQLHGAALPHGLMTSQRQGAPGTASQHPGPV